MAPHSSTLDWQIPWMKEPDRLKSVGSLRVGHDWATSLSLFTFMHWRRKWQPIVLAWGIPGTGEPGGLLSVGSHRVGHDWINLAAAAAMGPDAMILVFWILSFKPDFLLSSFTLIKKLFSSSSLSAIRVISSAYLKLLIILQAILILVVIYPAQDFTWCTLLIS